MWLCYCFGYDITVRIIEMRMYQASGLNRKWCKSNFLQNIHSEYVLTPYSQCAQEISFKLHSFETLEIPGKVAEFKSLPSSDWWPFSAEICQGCTFDPKKEILYWVQGKDYWNIITHNAKHVTSPCKFCCFSAILELPWFGPSYNFWSLRA